MTKELEALKRIRQETCPATYMADFDKNECCDVIERALKRLEAIDNANPSEALECLNNIEADLIGLPKHITEYDEGFDNYLEDIEDNIDKVEQALLKAQFLEEEYNNLMEDKDNLESELFKITTPKHYLKWEDLEFNIDKQMMAVLLNGTKYTLIVGRNLHIDKLAFLRNGEINYYFLEADKQFFNDLHLERVEE